MYQKCQCLIDVGVLLEIAEYCFKRFFCFLKYLRGMYFPCLFFSSCYPLNRLDDGAEMLL